MTQRIVIPLLVILAFGAGFGARMWTEDDRALPPPPAPGSEFVRSHPAAVSDAKADGKSASARPDRAKLIADIEKVRPQIDAYRRRLEEIDGEFDHAFVALLTPEQREHYDAQQKKNAEHKAQDQARAAADTSPLSDEQISSLQQRPLWSALYKIAVTWRLDRATRDYKLDEAQRTQVRGLLETRREKFIALVDSTPPPSITLSQLATQAQKLK